MKKNMKRKMRPKKDNLGEQEQKQKQIVSSFKE